MASVSWEKEFGSDRSVAVFQLDRVDHRVWDLVRNATGVLTAEGMGDPLKVVFTYEELVDMGMRDIVQRLGQNGYISGWFSDSRTGAQYP